MGSGVRRISSYLVADCGLIATAGSESRGVLDLGIATVDEPGRRVRRCRSASSAPPPGPVLWFVRRPRIGPVMEAVDAVARPGSGAT